MNLEKCINPKLDFNIDEECKLVVFSLTEGTFNKVYKIAKGDKIIITEEKFLKNPWTYFYKLRIKRSMKWVDATPSILFANENQLSQIFLGNDFEDISWILSDDIDKMPTYSKFIVAKIISKLVDGELWISYEGNYESLKKFIQYIFKNLGYKPYFIVEACFYLEYIIKLREILKKHGIFINWNKNIVTQLYKDDSYKLIVYDLELIIKECETYLDTLQSANIIVGKIYDFIGKRDIAIQKFKKAISFKEDNIVYLGEIGLYTYTFIEDNSINYKEKILFINDYEPISDIVIVYSLDLKYLKAYGPQLMYMCNIFDNQHFHLHIVGKSEEVKVVAEETIELFDEISRFRGKQTNPPTLSTEEVPNSIVDPVTFYACSRFINAKYFMEYFNRDIYILDADMLFIKLMENYFKQIKSYDIVATLNASLDYFSSFKKFQAGNMYFKNNKKVKDFLDLVKIYIVQNMNKNIVWTLDQNALAFAYDYFRDNGIDINIYNAWLLDIPTLQQSTMKEKILSK